MTSALPRPLVFRYPSNRMAAAGFALGLLGGRWRGGNWASGVNCAVSTFLAWSMARELDPDHHASSEVVVALALLSHLYLSKTPAHIPNWHTTLNGTVNLGTQLSSLRVLSASVGPAPTPADMAQMAAGAALNARTGQPVAALLPALSLGLSAAQQDHQSAPLEGTGAALLTAAVPAAPQQDKPQAKHDLLSDLISLGALGLGYSLTRPEAVRSHADIPQNHLPMQHLSAERLQATRALAVAAVGTLLVRRESKQAVSLALACAVVGLRRLKL